MKKKKKRGRIYNKKIEYMKSSGESLFESPMQASSKIKKNFLEGETSWIQNSKVSNNQHAGTK